MSSGGTVAVVGTLVWDRIVDFDRPDEPTEGWGGIAYSLAAMSAALDPSWRILAIVKVGSDLANDAHRMVEQIPGVDLTGLVVVPEANNRVEIRYETERRRTERLTGGVPGWTWDELHTFLDGCDGVYVNFISGYEMDLDTALRLPEGCSAPTYADLHSLFLDRNARGIRVPRRLDRPSSWLSCFDAVQMNEEEFTLLGPHGDPWNWAEGLVGSSALELVAVTLGSGGVAFVAAGPGSPTRGAVPLSGPAVRGDPTGCGDVWGATMFAGRLQGRDLRAAMSEANRLAALSVEYRGAEGLHRHLAGSSYMEERA